MTTSATPSPIKVMPGRRTDHRIDGRRQGLIVALLALGGSLFIFAPLTVLGLRRDALSVRDGPLATVEIVSDGMRFLPTEIRVHPGATVRLDLVNQDPSGSPHDIQTFGQRHNTRLIAWPGERRSTAFTASSKPGRYAFVCTLRGHSAAGHAGTIVVE